MSCSREIHLGHALATLLPGPWNDCSSPNKMKQTVMKQSHEIVPSISACEEENKAEAIPSHSKMDYPNWMSSLQCT